MCEDKRKDERSKGKSPQYKQGSKNLVKIKRVSEGG